MSVNVFSKIRSLACRLGISCPESDEGLFSVSLFGSIERQIKRLYVELGDLHKELDAKKAREKELEAAIKELIEWKPILAYEKAVEDAKSLISYSKDH